MTRMTTTTDFQQHAATTTGTFIQRAAACGSTLAQHASRHDIDGTWVTESFEHVRHNGLLALGVPTDLGGEGATISDLAMVQRELAHHCGSTALATAMHQHVTAFTAWRYRRGLPGAQATLRRIAEEGIVLVSTGGGDFTRPRGTATKVDGGYRVTGRKPFASQAPVGVALSTMFCFDDPAQGPRVLNMSVPFASEGVTIDETWDALGMRGTGSHDITFDDVFVPEERVLANRPFDVLDPPLQVIVSIAMPIISAVYLGVAESAYRHAVAAVTSPTNPVVQRRGAPIERAYRDVRAAKFHPLTMEATLLHAGRLALGVPCDHI